MKRAAGFRSSNIQALRGAAALFVVVMHCFIGEGGLVADTSPVMGQATRFAASFGPAGVDIFFVISGMIIYTVAVGSFERRAGQPASARVAGFGLARLLRIYPLYWIVFACAIIEAIYFGGVDYAFDKWKTSRAALFLLSRNNDVVQVAWTLAFEMYFYAATTLLLFLGSRRFRLGFAAWAVVQFCLVAAWSLSPAFQARVPWLGGYLVVLPQVLEFVMGAIVAELVLRGAVRIPRTVTLLGLGLFVAGCGLAFVAMQASIYGLGTFERVMWYGVPAALVLCGLVALEPQGFVLPQWLRRVGDASYSLYLWHLLLLPLFQQSARYWDVYDPIPRPLFALGAATLCTGLALALSRWVEQPLHDVSRKLVRATEDRLSGAWQRNPATARNPVEAA